MSIKEDIDDTDKALKFARKGITYEPWERLKKSMDTKTADIWLCYTESSSEPFFHGYVKTKEEAIDWVKETAEFDYPDEKMELNIQDDHIECSNDDHHVLAVKLERIT